MQSTSPSDNGPIVYGNMPCDLYRVYKNTVVADNTIMRYMNIRHEQAVFADYGFEFIGSATTYRHSFPDDGIIPNKGLCFFSCKFQVLGNGRYGGTWED